MKRIFILIFSMLAINIGAQNALFISTGLSFGADYPMYGAEVGVISNNIYVSAESRYGASKETWYPWGVDNSFYWRGDYNGINAGFLTGNLIFYASSGYLSHRKINGFNSRDEKTSFCYGLGAGWRVSNIILSSSYLVNHGLVIKFGFKINNLL